MKTETISAISTAIGTAGVGIIRLSGDDAISIADKIFDKPLAAAPDRQIIFGHVTNSAGEIIDEVLILIMRAPKSYTRENVVEIQCHGGSEVLREILSRTFEAGARPAERGECHGRGTHVYLEDCDGPMRQHCTRGSDRAYCRTRCVHAGMGG